MHAPSGSFSQTLTPNPPNRCAGSSYEGLADHLQQLCASADRRPEARSWAKGADTARAAVQGLQEANETLAGIVGQHKLGVHKASCC